MIKALGSLKFAITIVSQKGQYKIWLFVPVFIYFLVFALSLYFLNEPIQNSISSAWRWLAWIPVIVLATFSSYFIGQVLMSPFLSLLAESVYKETGVVSKDRSLSESFIQGFKMLSVSLLRSVVIIAILVCLYVFAFIPFLVPLTLMAALLLVVFDLADPSLEVLELSLRERFSFFINNLRGYWLFSGCIGLVSLIPGLLFLLLPVLVIAISHYTYMCANSSSSETLGDIS